MQEIMLYLQQNSYYGTIISMCVVVFFYLLFSILLIVFARRNGLNICASGMIPIFNLLIPIRVLIKNVSSREKKPKKEKEVKEEIFGEDDEIIL